MCSGMLRIQFYGRKKIAVLVSGGWIVRGFGIAEACRHDVHAFCISRFGLRMRCRFGECHGKRICDICERCVRSRCAAYGGGASEGVLTRGGVVCFDDGSPRRTPNSDMLWQSAVKFGAFLETLAQTSFDRVATGRTMRERNSFGENETSVFTRPSERSKRIFSHSFRRRIFASDLPIGGIRRIACENWRKNSVCRMRSEKTDQGICFLGKVQFDEFLQHYLGTKRDLIEYETGKKVGEHEASGFTIGQRKGVKLSGGPWFVVGKDAAKNEVFVSNAWRGAEGRETCFDIENINWISGTVPRKRTFELKIRHGETRIPCSLRALASRKWRVKLDRKEAGIAPDNSQCSMMGKCAWGRVISVL